jgi:hypothetical protein
MSSQRQSKNRVSRLASLDDGSMIVVRREN